MISDVQLLPLLGAGIILYPIFLVIYRLYFHPLAKFPGPKLAAATGWYETFIDLTSNPAGVYIFEISRMHDIYGPIVRINPHEIHVRDAPWVDMLYTGPAHGQRDKYPPTAIMTGVPKSIFGTVSHELHRLRRSAYSSLFSKANIAAATDLIYDNMDLMIDRMDAQMARDGSAEMRFNYLAFATDTVAEYCTGKTRALLRDEHSAHEWHKTIVTLTELTLVGRHFPWSVPLMLRLPMLIVRRLLAKSARFIALHREMEVVAQQKIAEYHAKDEKYSDTGKNPTVFDLILSNENLPLSEKAFDRVSQEAVLCVAAGGETTARSLTTATYYLLSHPAALARLREELLAVMPDADSRPPLSRLEQLEWLTAVIKESLRVMGLSTTRFPLIAPNQALRYKDWVIPAGTPVSMTVRDILLDPEVFQDPLEFRPERWLSNKADLDRFNRSYVPFGRGNRMCLGLNLGYAELYIALASLFRRRTLELYDVIKERDIDIVRDCFIGEVSLETKGVKIRLAKDV
ncbi:putative flavonoid 3-hydroxylase [Xylariomycetidae sp. FL2044]|nr:putative flavonoid 3-hydroxylase [Xylariomycetidae sp. FL2044]